MDVSRFGTTPGTPVISYFQQHPPANNQLWKKVPAGENTFYLVSKLGPNCKITVQVSCLYVQSLMSKFAIQILCPLGIALPVPGTSMVSNKHSPPLVPLPVQSTCPVDTHGTLDIQWRSHPHYLSNCTVQWDV